MTFFLETLVSGLLAGVLYALVAIGFVLIYKASGVFNYAQGSMVLFAALTFVTLVEHGLPFWASFAATAVVILIGAALIERLVLRPLVNRDGLTLFMATLGLSFVIEGLAQLVMGTDVHQLDLGIEDIPIDVGPVSISQFDIYASAISGTLVVVLSLLASKTRIGIALRAVADDTLAAQSIGIRPADDLARGLDRRRIGGAGGGPALGGAAGRAVFAVLRRAEGAAGADHRRLQLDPGRHRRRIDRRHIGSPGRYLSRSPGLGQRLDLVRLCPCPRLPAGAPRGPLR